MSPSPMARAEVLKHRRGRRAAVWRKLVRSIVGDEEGEEEEVVVVVGGGGFHKEFE